MSHIEQFFGSEPEKDKYKRAEKDELVLADHIFHETWDGVPLDDSRALSLLVRGKSDDIELIREEEESGRYNPGAEVNKRITEIEGLGPKNLN